MNRDKIPEKSVSFEYRKLVHYALIICILMIQIIIGLFFYIEYGSRKKTAFLEMQLDGITAIRHLTTDSQMKLDSAQNLLYEYKLHKNQNILPSFFKIINRLTQNLTAVENISDNNPKIKFDPGISHNSVYEIRSLQKLADSTQKISTQKSNIFDVPKLQPFNLAYNFEKFDVKTETFSDSVVKKGLVGRLKDAFTGKINVHKDSTVVTVQNSKVWDGAAMKNEIGNILNDANLYYLKEVERIHTTKNSNGEQLYLSMFDQLMTQTNSLLKRYQSSIGSYQSGLEAELAAVTSKSNTYRIYLVSGLMCLMFIVSVLILYFTRIAFIYEQRLNAANKQIRMNLNFKNRILGMLSHELRSPLTIIGLFIYRINKKNTDPNIKEYLKSISFTSETLLMQANQILEYTKNQQVQNRLIPVSFNLKNELRAIITSIEPYIETRNNRLVFTENIDPETVVFSDKTKINQIFMNILGNANKFTENGSIAVTVSAAPTEEDSLRLTVVVRDTGAGIAQSDLGKIFEPYYQGAISEEVENLGAGLGLCLCREIIELYPGDISVSSEPGQGTEVTFWINLKQNY